MSEDMDTIIEKADELIEETLSNVKQQCLDIATSINMAKHAFKIYKITVKKNLLELAKRIETLEGKVIIFEDMLKVKAEIEKDLEESGEDKKDV